MKKILSVILAVLMLTSTTLFSGLSAFAAVKAETPEIAIGATVDLSVTAVSEDVLNATEEVDEEKLDVWYAKFTPDANGWYEIIFDTKYACKGIASEDGLDARMAMCAASLTDSKGANVNSGLSMNMEIPEGTGEDANFLIELLKELGFGETPSFTAELTKGETYYLQVVNASEEAYNTKLTVRKHAHQLKDAYEKATVSYDKDWDMIDSEDGFKGKRCSCDYCDYEEGKDLVAVDNIIIKDQTYTGKKRTPKVTVKLEDGKTLSKKNYTVKYTNNKNVGLGKAIIKFKGDYKGKVTMRFKITPKKTAITSVKAGKRSATVSWKKRAKMVSGYQLQYSTSKSFKKAKKVNVKGAKTVQKTIKKLKAGKKYYFRIRTYKVVNGDKYYSKWSKKKAVKL